MAGCDTSGAKAEVSSSAEEHEMLVNENGRNSLTIGCPRCDSVILKGNVATRVDDIVFDLPPMTTTNVAASSQVESEMLRRFWSVPDMFQFENVGYTNSVNGIKYLTCADCEIGPIGYQDPLTKVNYVALERVRHL